MKEENLYKTVSLISTMAIFAMLVLFYYPTPENLFYSLVENEITLLNIVFPMKPITAIQILSFIAFATFLECIRRSVCKNMTPSRKVFLGMIFVLLILIVSTEMLIVLAQWIAKMVLSGVENIDNIALVPWQWLGTRCNATVSLKFDLLCIACCIYFLMYLERIPVRKFE